MMATIITVIRGMRMKVYSLFITDLEKNAFGAQLIRVAAGDLLQRGSRFQRGCVELGLE